MWCLNTLASRVLEALTLNSMMLNCYKPLAAPPQDDGERKDGKVPIGDGARMAKPDPAAHATRIDGRTPYDMRQVQRVNMSHDLYTQGTEFSSRNMLR